MFLTGCNTISYLTLEKLRDFYENGGTIISTTQLPYKSSEKGEDKKVVDLVYNIFGLNSMDTDLINVSKNNNANGPKLIADC